jgi:hypothetical protein
MYLHIPVSGAASARRSLTICRTAAERALLPPAPGVTTNLIRPTRPPSSATSGRHTAVVSDAKREDGAP